MGTLTRPTRHQPTGPGRQSLSYSSDRHYLSETWGKEARSSEYAENKLMRPGRTTLVSPGRNLDALWDVLSADIEGPIEVLWDNPESSRRAPPQVRRQTRYRLLWRASRHPST